MPLGSKLTPPRGSKYYIELYQEKFKRHLLLNRLGLFQEKRHRGGVELKSIKIRWVGGCFLEYPYGLYHKKEKIVLVVPPFSSSVPPPQHLFSWNSPYVIRGEIVLFLSSVMNNELSVAWCIHQIRFLFWGWISKFIKRWCSLALGQLVESKKG